MGATPRVSVVVVVHDMERELARTLASLAPGYQRDLDVDDLEVVVVDNGSARPVPDALLAAYPGRLRSVRLDPAPPSPARAANTGIDLAEGELVGLIVDGARMASPGLVATALSARRLADRPVIASLGWHLGPVRHMEAAAAGYDQRVEDELLAGLGWEDDGYALFGASTLAGSSGRGWFGPIGESSALFLPVSLWRELGGLDEAFALPGGGLVNHDLYRRACDAPGTELVVLLGEGTFHQFHGGAATSGRFAWDAMHDDYVARRGGPYRPPDDDPLFVGRVPHQVLDHLETSIELARRRLARGSRADRAPTGPPATARPAVPDGPAAGG